MQCYTENLKETWKEKSAPMFILVESIDPSFSHNPVSDEKSLKFRSLHYFEKILQHEFYTIKEMDAEI